MSTYERQRLAEKVNSLVDLYQITGGTDLLMLYEQFSYVLLAHTAMIFDRTTPDLPEAMAYLSEGIMPLETPSFGNETYLLYQDIIHRLSHVISGQHDMFKIQIANSDVFTSILDIVTMTIPYKSNSYPKENLHFLLECMLDNCINKSRDDYFYTSANLASFIVKAAGRAQMQSMYDPFCGTGAFLTATKQIYNPRYISANEQSPQLKRITQINMLFYGLQADIQSQSDIEIANRHEMFDFVVSNPPFNTIQIDDAAANDLHLKVQTKHRYRVLIQLLLKKIKYNGKGAIVVPDSFLFNSNRDATHIRQWILDQFFVDGIISLPANTFHPKANVKASVIIVTAVSGEKRASNEMVAMLACEKGLKNKAPDASDFEVLLKLWKDRDSIRSEWVSQMQDGSTLNLHGIASPAGWRHEDIWFANMDEIRQMDYSLLPQRYQPAASFQMSKESPQDIIREVMEIERQILSALESLEEELPRNV